MKKSIMLENPRRVARRRMLKKFNLFPSDSKEGRYTVFIRVTNPEGMRLTLAVAQGTRVEGWFEFGEELMALYSLGDALVLFDRFINKDHELDTIICVAAASASEVGRMTDILEPSSSPEWDEILHFEFDND